MKREAYLGLLVLISLGVPQTASGGVRLNDRYVALLGGYDSNVLRLSSELLERSEKLDADARMLVFAGLGLELRSAGRIHLDLDAKPYFIKYQDFSEFDRGDVFLSGNLKGQVTRRFLLSVSNRYRFTVYPNREGWDQLYNSLRTKLSFHPFPGWRLSLQYRNLYRDNPRRNLEGSRANGAALSLRWNPGERWNIGALVERDYQNIAFVFPREVPGKRTWLDLSCQYLLGKSILLMGKYMYQLDKMDIIFLPGKGSEEPGQAGEEISDGILQSIRFLEDSGFNFHKHLSIFSLLMKLGSGSVLDFFLLFQKKYFGEKVVEIPARPERLDKTLVAQASYQVPVIGHSSLLLYWRFEKSKSNDPDHRYRLTTLGIGLKRSL